MAMSSQAKEGESSDAENKMDESQEEEQQQETEGWFSRFQEMSAEELPYVYE